MLNQLVIQECHERSDQEKISFPDLIAILNQAQVELYYADLIMPQKTYYSGNQALTIPSYKQGEPQLSEVFNREKIIEAIRQSQAGQIKYQEFIKKILDAGVIAYVVTIVGRKAIYMGKKGEQHIESFPN